MSSPYARIQACAATAVILATPATLAAPGIYRCEVAGVATYQDRPCGEASAQYEPDTARVSTYAPPAASRTPTGAPRKPVRRDSARASIAQAQAKRAEECRRIAASLEDIKAKARAGYNAKEGERMRVRRAKLDEQRRAHKCG